jgi:hypothetical protein
MHLSYPIKGALLGVALLIALLATAYAIPETSGVVMQIFAMPLWLGAMSSMGAESLSWGAMIAGFVFTAAIYAGVGALLGKAYASSTHKKLFLTVCACIFVLAPVVILAMVKHDTDRQMIQGISTPEECESYEDQSQKSRCYSGYYRIFAPLPSICESMVPAEDYAFERNECVKGVGAMTNDETLCRQFIDPAEQQACIDGFGQYGPFDPYDYEGKPPSPYVRRS